MSNQCELVFHDWLLGISLTMITISASSNIYRFVPIVRESIRTKELTATWEVSYYTEIITTLRVSFYLESTMAQRDHYYIKRPQSELLQGEFITQSRLLSRESIIIQ